MPRLDLCGPGVDDRCGDVSKMGNIPSRQAGAICQDNACDHGVTQLSHSPFTSPERRKISRQSGCLLIETRDALSETIEDSLENFR